MKTFPYTHGKIISKTDVLKFLKINNQQNNFKKVKKCKTKENDNFSYNICKI